MVLVPEYEAKRQLPSNFFNSGPGFREKVLVRIRISTLQNYSYASRKITKTYFIPRPLMFFFVGNIVAFV